MAALLQRGDLRGLVGGQYVGEDVIGCDAQPCCHGMRGMRVVTRNHDDAQAAFVQSGDGFGGARLGLVGEGQQDHGMRCVAGIEAQQRRDGGAL